MNLIPSIGDSVANAATGLHHKYRLGCSPTAPLAYLVHGRAGDYDKMWAFRRCVPDDFTIATPQATLADPVGGLSWWPMGGEASLVERATPAAKSIEQFVAGFESHYGLVPEYRIAVGFSMGAALLSLVMQRSPSLFAGVGILAGFVIRVPVEEGAAPLPRVFMAHGTADETVGVDKAREGRDYLVERGAKVEYFEDPVGHKVGVTGMSGLTKWVKDWERRPLVCS